MRNSANRPEPPDGLVAAFAVGVFLLIASVVGVGLWALVRVVLAFT